MLSCVSCVCAHGVQDQAACSNVSPPPLALLHIALLQQVLTTTAAPDPEPLRVKLTTLSHASPPITMYISPPGSGGMNCCSGFAAQGASTSWVPSAAAAPPGRDRHCPGSDTDSSRIGACSRALPLVAGGRVTWPAPTAGSAAAPTTPCCWGRSTPERRGRRQARRECLMSHMYGTCGLLNCTCHLCNVGDP
jgi:hypothetical protein